MVLSVPGGRAILFLFLPFSAEFSREGCSLTSGPFELLKRRGSLLVVGSKGRALSPKKLKQEPGQTKTTQQYINII